jgi:hypothetical protein
MRAGSNDWMNHEQQQILDYLREENRIRHAAGDGEQQQLKWM